jgi:hypothetical protein
LSAAPASTTSSVPPPILPSPASSSAAKSDCAVAAGRVAAFAANPAAAPRSSRRDGRRHRQAAEMGGWKRWLLLAAGLATKDGRPCYKGRPAMLQGVGGGGGCCRRRPILLQRAGDFATRWLLVLLPAAEAVATSVGRPCYLRAEAVAASGGRPCYKRRPTLLQRVALHAARGSWRCYNGLSWFLR